MVNLIAASTENLTVRQDFPHRIRIENNLRIPLKDGRNLSARVWIPETANKQPVPAIVEYAPFRYRDFTYPRDAIIHPWFAGHGYASIRLEPAGAMDSDGVPMDEYVRQEQTDCVEALEWISEQPWCSGATGMFGMSWGAFSALQVAALRPPSLKAIIPVHGTDERFGDDIHYKGGCLLTANLAWGALYQTYMARPPSAASFGTDWKRIWKERAEMAPNILEAWVGHQNRDSYWRHASVCENHANIEAATFVICGWADGYTNAATRMAERLTCPHKVLIGPWAHTYPHIALPGPQIGFLQEATRWWDRWLKKVDNGADEDPKFVYYMQGAVPPAHSYDYRDGRWIAEASWPSVHLRPVEYFLNATGLGKAAEEGPALSVRSPLGNAMTGGEWLPHGVGPEMPLDQRGEDAGSLCFDTPPLDEPIEICGRPTAYLRISSDKSRGTICVRLCDVAPDGTSTLITYELLNLMHPDGFETAREIEPGSWFDVAVPLNAIAQGVPSGHRIRLAVSTQSWPLSWPAAQSMTLSLMPGKSRLSLPLRDPEAPDGPVPEFPKVEIPSEPSLSWLRPVRRERSVTTDIVTGTQTRSYVKDDGAFIVNENAQLVDSVVNLTYRHDGQDPLSCRADLTFELKVGDEDNPAILSNHVTVKCDQASFIVNGKLTALHEGNIIHERQLDTKIPRHSS